MVKPVGIGTVEETAGFSGEPQMYANPPTLETTIMTAAGGAPVAYRKWGSDWKKGECQASPQKSASSGIVPSSNHTPHIEPQSSEAGCPTLENTQGSTPYNLTGVLRQEIKAALSGTQTQGGC